MKSRILDLETLLRIPYVEPEFDISPDGAQIAFSWRPTGRWEVYLAPLDGSAPPRQLTSGPGAKFAPRWSPDGRRLAYALDLDGSERFDIHVCDLATGQHANLTPDTPDAIQPNFCWSPDGSQIAFASDRSGQFDTYVMPAAGGMARPLLSLPHPDWDVRWSPDGRWLAIVTEGMAQDHWTFVVPVNGGRPHTIADTGGPIHAKDPCWSPDSSRIAFSSNTHGFSDIGVYDLETGEIAWATGGPGDKEHPAWSPDGRWLAYVAGDGPTAALAVLEPGKGPPMIYQIEPGVCDRPRFTPDGAHLVFLFGNPRRPDDLWLLSLRPGRRGEPVEPSGQALAGGSFHQLTHSLSEQVFPEHLLAALMMPTEVHYPSLDGRSVPAVLYRPAQVEELPPAVVYVHGGPDSLTQFSWEPSVLHLVSQGWVVLAPNYRGSTGYGREWQLANRFDLGDGDTQDVVAGADYLVREGLADPARIAVTGVSWGGYLTMTSLTRYPDRWAAGSAVVPFLNWFTGHANSREDLKHWDRENLGDPVQDCALYYERSPFFFLDRVTAPVQLICGAHDVRCPASESIQARDRLVVQGKECELVLYEDEGHRFLNLENLIDAEKRGVDFLARVFESETKKVDKLFAEWDRPDSPGCAVGIIRDGQWVYKRGYGIANLEHGIPISPRTVFRIASTSKQFTATCVALLAEQGKLSLDDDIRTYLPELPTYERTITIRHLVHHTSGLRDYLVLMELAGMGDEDFYTDDEVIEMLARQKELNFVPGDEYLYSNSGYYLLGVIVKRVSGQPLRKFADEYIFRPLGMTSTHFHDDHTEIVKHRAAGYSPREEGGYRIDMTTLDVVGDGGVFTTVEDLFLWNQNFYHDRLGKGVDDLIQQVLTPGALNSGEKLDYAFGLVVSDYRGLRMISHSGGFVGFRAEMIRFPEQAFSVICLANLSTVNLDWLARQVADIYLADHFEDAAARAKPITLPQETLQDKVGVYVSAVTGTVLTLRLQDGRLAAEVFGENVPLIPVGEAEFVAHAPFDAHITFERQEQSGPWRMHMRVEDERPDTLQEIEIVSPGPEQLAEYAGDYYSAELQTTYKPVLAGDKLHIKHRNAPQEPLRPALSDMFWVRELTFFFTRDETGRVSGFTLQAGRVRNIHFARL